MLLRTANKSLSLYFSADDDCNFESRTRPVCGFTNEGWRREFSNNVPNARSGKLKNVLAQK